MTIAIINYGIGNLGSVQRALSQLGGKPVIVEDPDMLCDAERIILPGVGGFAEGMMHLRERGWVEAIRCQVIEGGKPILGICLGMQLLASFGEEGGITAGLDLIPGKVVHLDTLGCSERIPHVGWNDIQLTETTNELFAGIPSGTDFYFVHSYSFFTQDNSHVLAKTNYGVPIAAAVGNGAVWGTQFHPEKSSKAGFRLLNNFLNFKLC